MLSLVGSRRMATKASIIEIHKETWKHAEAHLKVNPTEPSITVVVGRWLHSLSFRPLGYILGSWIFTLSFRIQRYECLFGDA